MKRLDQCYDLFDEACLIIHENLNINYLDCLIRVGKDILYGLNDKHLDEEDIIKLEKKYLEITDLEITDEEMRQVLQLLIIKAFKHANYSLDLMTPDYINYLFAHFIKHLFKDQNNLRVLDVCSGTGNLLNAVANFLQIEMVLYSIEKDPKLAELNLILSDLQCHEVQIFCQDCLQDNVLMCDIIIGDLPNEKINNQYLPYLIINKYNDHLTDNGYFLYLIENDFFSQPQISDFRQSFNGTLLGLIVLPDELFNKDHIGKSIIIGTVAKIENWELMIIKMPSLKEEKKFKEKINAIENWINRLEKNI